LGGPCLIGNVQKHPPFREEWWACCQIHHSLIGNDLVAKKLREKCVNNDVRVMICTIEDLDEMWRTLDTLVTLGPENTWPKP
jgi:hypothetical protein